MATLDQEDLDNIATIVREMLTRTPFSDRLDVRNLDPATASFAYTGTLVGAQEITLVAEEFWPGGTSSVTLGVFSAPNVWTPDAGWVDVLQDNACLRVGISGDNTEVGGGEVRIVAHAAQNRGAFVPIVIPWRPANLVGGTMYALADGQVQNLDGGRIFGKAAPALILPPLAGTITQSYALTEQGLNLVRGDSHRLTFNLGGDRTGWTPYFGVRKKGLGLYLVPAKQAVWIDQTLGTGYADFTAAENTEVGELEAEIELRNGDERATALKATIDVTDDVVK